MPATDKALRATLNLPKTAFPMRANAAKREPAVVTRLTTALYQRQQAQRGSDPKPFVLHDGPPYANGALHMGHFVNRTLKDVNCRFQLLQGKRVDYVPGWDCHGLPIELKALASAAADASPQEVRFMAFVTWWHNRSFPPHSAESNLNNHSTAMIRARNHLLWTPFMSEHWRATLPTRPSKSSDRTCSDGASWQTGVAPLAPFIEHLTKLTKLQS